jgi:hypothetical protein
MEVKTAVFYIHRGLETVERLGPDDDFFPMAFQLLGAGFEHLLKVTLSLGRLHVEGTLPPWAGSAGLSPQPA